ERSEWRHRITALSRSKPRDATCVASGKFELVGSAVALAACDRRSEFSNPCELLRRVDLALGNPDQRRDDNLGDHPIERSTVKRIIPRIGCVAPGLTARP